MAEDKKLPRRQRRTAIVLFEQLQAEGYTGTGTGKTHLAIAIAANLVRQGSWARFYNLVDLANDLEQENLAGRGGWLTASLSRFNLVVFDELG